MKTRIILFAIAAVALLSFTFVSANQTETASIPTDQHVAASTDAQGGLIMEDKADW